MSGVGKLSQIVFAVVAPGNIIANIIAGAIAEAGAQQAGDLMQDLKTGHLLKFVKLKFENSSSFFFF